MLTLKKYRNSNRHDFISGMIGYTLLSALWCTPLSVSSQQTVQFSQYMFNGMAINPAYAGYKEAPTANLSYRMQWTGIDGSPRTGTVSIDGVVNTKNRNIGLGILATSDRLGPQNTSSVYANYSYRLQLDNDDTKRICFGMAFGAVQHRLDATKFNPLDPLDYTVPTSNESRLTPDLRFGLYFYSPKYYLGASMLNALQTNVANNGTNLVQPIRHFYFTAGAMISVSEEIDIKPSFLIKEDLKAPTNLDITSYIVLNKKIWLGASLRTAVPIWEKSGLQNNLSNSDALAALMQLFVNDRLRVGYSFDFTTSKLARYQNGSHELSVSMSLKAKNARILSPRFF